ncbi:hypothetical protein Rhopal_007575-T1 [Rhodotorula paludigena]|uniref:Uncharacterized protein n=1 Tax=Rhodotorula paludigena TaxID=86838 RepID=A0AAV5H185_9BASI|nr:hypothetical protein Rhopal_007575-T1 [Rhodotorula paludigena]
MSHAVDSTHPVDPSIARMTEEAAKQKAVATQEKRELAGDADYHDHKHLDNNVNNPNALLENPLQGISHDRLEAMGRAFAREKGLAEFEEEFAKGAQVAQDPLAFESLMLLNDEDRNVLRREVGMDESVTNGANLFWPEQFGLVTDPARDPNASTNQWVRASRFSALLVNA